MALAVRLAQTLVLVHPAMNLALVMAAAAVVAAEDLDLLAAMVAPMVAVVEVGQVAPAQAHKASSQ